MFGKRSAMGIKIIAFVWFHFAWFACVYLGLKGLSLVSLALPIVSFFLLSRIETLTKNKLKKLFLLAAIGIVFDFLAIRLEWITFPQHEGLFPYWLLSMWLLFVAILPLTEFMKNQLLVAAILGAIFGPLSYYSGNALGVLFMSGTITLIAYALFWSIYFPLSLKFLKGSST
jgi:hypothetical protein